MENVQENSAETKEEYAFVSDRRLVGLLPMFILVLIIVLRISWTLYKSFGQKTRNQPQRRLYAGSRARPSLDHPEPTIYVSPSNLPPPPKYDFIAPPSYEEVVGIHYPNYQIQPISQPITAALAQSSSQASHSQSTTATSNDTAPRSNDQPTTITINERPVTATS